MGFSPGPSTRSSDQGCPRVYHRGARLIPFLHVSDREGEQNEIQQRMVAPSLSGRIQRNSSPGRSHAQGPLADGPQRSLRRRRRATEHSGGRTPHASARNHLRWHPASHALHDRAPAALPPHRRRLRHPQRRRALQPPALRPLLHRALRRLPRRRQRRPRVLPLPPRPRRQPAIVPAA